MTIKSKDTQAPTALELAIARHKAAQAAIDAFRDDPDGYPEHLGTAEFSPKRLAPAMRNSSKSCAICTLTRLEYLGRRLVNMNSVQSFSRSIVTSAP
jgi:hypothetical protein